MGVFGGQGTGDQDDGFQGGDDEHGHAPGEGEIAGKGGGDVGGEGLVKDGPHHGKGTLHHNAVDHRQDAKTLEGTHHRQQH